MVITDEVFVETDCLVVPPAGELEVRVGAGLTVLARSLTTLGISIKNNYFKLYICIIKGMRDNAGRQLD